MAPIKVDQGSIIIIDIGRNVSQPEEKNERSFFENARDCATRIVERKIISQGKSLLGVILLGSKKTNNNLAEQSPDNCRYIEVLFDLQYPTWRMIRDLPQAPSKAKGNWFDALLVAADLFQNGLSGFKIAHKKIILMTNFRAPCHLDASEIKQGIEGFQNEEYELDIIGPDIYSEENIIPDLEIARQFVEGTNGVSATFEYTMRYLLFHKKKAVNGKPWDVELSIGPNIKIPVSVYIRIKDEPVVGKWNKTVKDAVTNTGSTSEAIERKKIHINTENQTIVDSEQVIKGYLYGQKNIPFSEVDKSLLYDSGQKSLAVYGFTKSSNITWQCLNGDGLSYVFGRKSDKKAQYAIRCLVECLLELDLVGIVRRVYNNGNAPKMFALMPVIDTDNFVCLSLVGLCFKEDIKYMSFPTTNLKKYTCSDDQVNAFKELIGAMDLTRAYDESQFDDTEAFPIAKMVSPSAQYILDCIAFRAMHPNAPLPQPRDDIMMLFKVPPLIEKRSKDPIDKLKKLFVLNKVEVKKRDKKKNQIPIDDNQPNPTPSTSNDTSMDDMPKIQLDMFKKPYNIQYISIFNPINDFDTLKKDGKTLNELASQMTQAIESLVYGNIDGDYSKSLDAMLHLRTECLKSDPSHYNTWLKKFLVELFDRKQNTIIDLMKSKGLNYILQSENNLSTITDDTCEDSAVYDEDTVPTLTEVNISSDVNDLFDDM